MKILIITVAGMSTRFSESIGQQTLKCIYYEKTIRESLLYQLLNKDRRFDRYIIVGGFMYDNLKKEIESSCFEYLSKIVLIKNEFFKEYGSGYSLYLGLKTALKFHPTEIVFAEGDLYIDKESFLQITESTVPVITFNYEPIKANKSAVFYLDTQQTVHYIYDTSHKELIIREPFLEIYNSAQIWKFIVDEKFIEIYDRMIEEDWKGTNLIFIQKYFESLKRADYKMYSCRNWINCNTVNDFRKMQKEIDV